MTFLRVEKEKPVEHRFIHVHRRPPAGFSLFVAELTAE